MSMIADCRNNFSESLIDGAFAVPPAGFGILPAATGVHHLFEAQALRIPEASALVFKDLRLSYRELNQRAYVLSCALKDHGVRPGSLVAICAERAMEVAVAMLAVLKAGGAYVPLDPSSPDDRLRATLDDARPTALLSQRGLLSRFNASTCPVICLDEFPFLAEAGSELSVGPDGTELAYVVYTSGSTGKPKGVLIEHRSLLNHSTAIARVYDLRPGDRVLQFASLGFDVAAEEMFPTWVSGATLVMWPFTSGVAPIRNFVEFVESSKITVLNLPAPYWHEWVTELKHVGVPASVRLVIVGSDTVLCHKASVWREHTGGQVRLINAYGPSEATITATVFEVSSAPPKVNGSVPIGRPIDSVITYVLDEKQNPVAPGSAGELYIGGAGVARGYLNLPEQSAAKFIDDPFSYGGRLYRTGDCVRSLADGNLEFLGRLDDQVKIRGFRIETAEVETVLRRHPKIRDAVVVGREDEPGNRKLVAYVVGRNGTPPPARQLRKLLQGQLPHYMVPQIFVSVRQLPLTAGGKIDRGRLPPPRPSRADLDNGYIAPRTEIESTLAQIWESVLEISPVGVRDDFFELAGHSLLLVRVAALIEQRFSVNLALTALFQARTIEELARLVASKRLARPHALICAYSVQGSRPPLFCHGGSNDMARDLGTDQPLYWLDPHGMNGWRIPATIEEMAAEYLSELLLIQPRGPYWLLGYSFGGLVMLELARLLMQREEQIALLVLVDPSPPLDMKAGRQPERTARTANVNGASINFTGATSLGPLRNAWRRVRRIRSNAQDWLCKTCIALGRTVPPALRPFHFEQGCDRALRRYKAKVYPGSFMLFRRADNLTEAQWRSLALGHVDMHESWVDHNDFLERPFVQLICRQIDSQMRRLKSEEKPVCDESSQSPAHSRPGCA